MRLLVLSGTRFVGWAVVTGAVGRRWEVTTFNRGLSGADAPGAAPGGETDTGTCGHLILGPDDSPSPKLRNQA